MLPFKYCPSMGVWRNVSPENITIVEQLFVTYLAGLRILVCRIKLNLQSQVAQLILHIKNKA